MKRIAAIAILVAVSIATAVGIARATTSTTVVWPANCAKIGCATKHLNALHNRDVAQNAQIAALKSKVAELTSWKKSVTGCLSHLNMTDYSVDVYDLNTGNYRWFDAYEGTHFGDNVDAQFIVNTCTPSVF